MGGFREDGALPYFKTDAGRRYYQARGARRRQAWRDAGLCVECGRDRKWPTLRCGACLVGNVIRVDRSQFKKRMAKADMHEGQR